MNEEETSLAFSLSDGLSPSQLEQKRLTIEQRYVANDDGADSGANNLLYLEEFYYFVPIQIALQLQRSGYYQAALDWFRIVYDFSAATPPKAAKKIYYGLVAEQYLDWVSERPEDWLRDPLNPHLIAGTRPDTYTRYTLLSIVRCLLEFADSEYTLDNVESVARARSLYTTALELLAWPELKESRNQCTELVIALETAAHDALQHKSVTAIERAILTLGDARVVEQAVAAAALALDAGGPWESRVAAAWSGVERAKESIAAPPTIGDVVETKSDAMMKVQNALLSVPELATAASRVGNAAAADFRVAMTRISGLTDRLDDAEFPQLRGKVVVGKTMTPMSGGKRPVRSACRSVSRAQAISRLLTPRLPVRVLHSAQPDARRVAAAGGAEPVQAAQLPEIAGMVRQLDPYAAPTDTVSGLPMIGAAGQLVLPGVMRLRPTAYRYSTLIERAKQLVALAQQVESAFLGALQLADAERYTLLKARQDVALARAGVRLQNLRVREAEDGVGLAELQRARAQIQVDHYQALLDEGISDLESVALALTIASIPLPSGVSSGTGGATVTYSPSGIAQSLASIFSTYASFERRREDWEFQKSLADQDVLIGAQQVKLAQDHVRVVGQERLIAEMQADHAEAGVNFLTNKFTNVELYDWMSDVLEGVYAFFLRQATVVAALADQQLAFERQEMSPPFIQADYWEVPESNGGDFSTDGKTPDRRGLTSSARLLQDIFQLDQHAFDTPSANCRSRRRFRWPGSLRPSSSDSVRPACWPSARQWSGSTATSPATTCG